MTLVDRSTGQFIYVTTVIKFLSTGKVRVTPQQRLEVILRAEPVLNSTSPYPDLDQLYSQILHLCQNDGRKLQRVLQLIVSPIGLYDLGLPDTFTLQGSRPIDPTSAVGIEQLLGLGQGEVVALLSGLHSILHIPKDRAEGVSVLHASFTDFLLDCNRSSDYHAGEKLDQRTWKEMVIVYQAKWLLRLSAGPRSTLSLEGVYDHDLGSLNLWDYLYDNLCLHDIAITDEIAEALNGFDPHRYLEMILHWKYQYSLPYSRSVWEVCPEDRQDPQDWSFEYHVKGVRAQLERLYNVFCLLKLIHQRKLHDFVKKCRSFFRGFHVAFPREHRFPFFILSCQLSLSSLLPNYKYPLPVGPADFTHRIIPLFQSHSCTTFRIVPLGQTSKHGIPPMWDIEYISPVRAQLLWKLLELVFEDDAEGSVMSSRITHIVSSDKTEDWPRNLAMLNWRKTWRAYLTYQQPWYGLYGVTVKLFGGEDGMRTSEDDDGVESAYFDGGVGE
ncbi:hypothetical protein PQX77_018579 [Marasmius sp. AFHP31]|nr:hypothetical protein PQX77_018579 [Marasmius sp. AFHP31]